MAKKLLHVITNKKNSNKLTKGFLDAGFYVTVMEATGGFTKKKLAIILLAIPEKSIDDAVKVVKKCCPVKVESSTGGIAIPPSGEEDFVQAESVKPTKVREDGATVLISPLDKIRKL
ncbi:cyclic-di-AMP receptor [Patescibacteria group bacterium]